MYFEPEGSQNVQMFTGSELCAAVLVPSAETKPATAGEVKIL